MTPLPKLGAPAGRAMEAAGIRSLEDLTRMTRAELAGLHGIGRHALAALDQALDEAGLRLADEAD